MTFIYFKELATAIHYDQKIELRSFEEPEELLIGSLLKLRDIKLDEYFEIEALPVRRVIPDGDKLIIYLEDNE